MSRFLGGVFGNTEPSTATTGIKGVYDQNDQYYMKQEGGWAPQLVISGGTEYSWSDPTGSWKSHTFSYPHPTSAPDQFVVSGAPPTATIHFAVVGGGGAGGADGSSGGGSGGGGGGGYRVSKQDPTKPINADVTVPALPIPGTQTYIITVGAGGDGNTFVNRQPGGDSKISTPTADLVVASGGGGGGYCCGEVGATGGSGGGGACPNASGGATTASPDPLTPTVQGYPGYQACGGGGGAGTSGGPSAPGGQGHSGGKGFNTWLQQGPTHAGHSCSHGGEGDRSGTSNGPAYSTFGGGGSGTTGNGTSSGDGGNGVVIILYDDSTW